MNESDHDILIEIRSDLKHVITQQCDQECRLRVIEQENQRMFGKREIVAVLGSFLVAITTVYVSLKGLVG